MADVYHSEIHIHIRGKESIFIIPLHKAQEKKIRKFIEWCEENESKD